MTNLKTGHGDKGVSPGPCGNQAPHSLRSQTGLVSQLSSGTSGLRIPAEDWLPWSVTPFGDFREPLTRWLEMRQKETNF